VKTYGWTVSLNDDLVEELLGTSQKYIDTGSISSVCFAFVWIIDLGVVVSVLE